MAITHDPVSALEESLRARLHLSGDTLDVDGIGPRAVRPPAPSRLLLEGRRVRTRRRLAAGSFAAAASVAVAGVGAGAAAGVFTLPWLRADGSTGPSTLYASPGTRVGDLVNALDAMLPGGDEDAWRIYSSGQNAGYSELYRKAVDAETDDSLRHLEWGGSRVYVPVTTDRVIGLDTSVSFDGSGLDARGQLTMSRTDPGEPTAVRSTDDLGRVDLGEDRRGGWLQVRPSAEDGWLIVALLPADAEAIQVRVAGTADLLPLGDLFVEKGLCASEVALSGGEAICLDGGSQDPQDHPTVVALRFATTDAEPPIDAVTYIDGAGRFVFLGSDAETG